MEAQITTTGIVWADPDGTMHGHTPDSPEWYTWLANADHRRLLFVHPTLGRFLLRHERKQRGGWYWSIYCRWNGRLRKAYLGKGAQVSFQRVQWSAHALVSGTAHPDLPAPPDMLPASAPLLAAKLTPPPLHRRAVPRPRLVAQLDAASTFPVTLVIAPVGSGKTSLLAAWAHTRRANKQAHNERDTPMDVPAIAWLALDAHDNDPARFLAYLWAAWERLHLSARARSLPVQQAPQSISIEDELRLWLHAIGTASAPILVVIDEYHVIDNPVIHEALRFCIDHLPAHLRFVIAGRSEPPLAVARLRAHGHLSELGPQELRFTPHETHQFLTEYMGLGATLEEATALEQRTEGWAAGIYLAAVAALRHGAGLHGLAHISGSQRAIVDYLATEVFAGQPADVQRFLLRTAILDRLCGPLCDALCDDVDATPPSTAPSQGILDQLDRANLFVVPLDADHRWYRYHQLFGDFLRDQLQRSAPDLLPELHRRAANWYADNGLMIEAVDHGLRADDSLAATLIERCGRSLLMRGAVTTVLQWTAQLPDTLLAKYPHVALIAAWALTAAGRLDEAALRLDTIEEGLGRNDDERSLTGEVLAARAAIAGLRRDLPTTVALCHAALARLAPHQSYIRSVVLQLLGGTAHASGDAHGADRALTEALRLSQASGNLFIAAFSTRQLADVRVMQGRLADAARLYQQALDSDRAGAYLPRFSVTGMAAVGLGELYYLRNDLASAARSIKEGLAAGEHGQDVEILVRGNIALARVCGAAGDTAAAFERIAAAENAAATGGTTWLNHWVQSERARIAALGGDDATARAWAQTSGLSLDDAPSYLYESNYLTLARIAIAQANDDGDHSHLVAANRLIQRLWDDAQQAGRVSSQIEIGTLAAQGLHKLGQIDGACAALLRALQCDEPINYTRVFLDGGTTVSALLRRLLRDDLPPELRVATKALYGAFTRATPVAVPDGPELLSSRELEVLRFVAAGQTNQQIGRTLVVSIGTIKKHLNNVYGKLGVSSRTEAVARARQLGIPLESVPNVP